MKPHKRSLGLRAAVLFAMIAALFGVRAATVSPLPALFASFDKAVSAVEDQIRALEQPPARASQPPLAELLARLDGEITVACDAATEELDRVLESRPALPPLQRAVVRACIDRHLWDARHALARTTDPEIRAEYDALCERLHEVRDFVG